MKSVTFGDLYSFLEERVDPKEKGPGLELVEQFCEEHDVSFEKLKQVLEYFGTHDDYESVFVLSGLIDDKAEMPSNEQSKERHRCQKAHDQIINELKYGEDFAEVQWEAQVKQYDEAQYKAIAKQYWQAQYKQ
jgi:hypothetical protein